MSRNTISAEQYAIDVRKELAIPIATSIDFDYVLDCLNIRYRKVCLKAGVLGASEVIGLKKLIVVSSDIGYSNRERFTIAHELGHIIMHHGYSQCKDSDIWGHRPTKWKEIEANNFASAFLLPPIAVKEKAISGDITFNMAGKLSEQYGISLTATIIALVKASPFSVCAFFQSDGRILYSVKSGGCLATPRVGPVLANVGVQKVNSKNIGYNSSCSYDCWFVEQKGKDFDCYEETRYFPNLNHAISIVHIGEKD